MLVDDWFKLSHNIQTIGRTKKQQNINQILSYLAFSTKITQKKIRKCVPNLMLLLFPPCYATSITLLSLLDWSGPASMYGNNIGSTLLFDVQQIDDLISQTVWRYASYISAKSNKRSPENPLLLLCCPAYVYSCELRSTV